MIGEWTDESWDRWHGDGDTNGISKGLERQQKRSLKPKPP